MESVYQITGNTYGFTVENHDQTKALTIDPTLSYSTYLEGSDSDVGYGIAVDSNGNVYITGETYSTDFPTTVGAFQKTSAAAKMRLWLNLVL